MRFYADCKVPGGEAKERDLILRAESIAYARFREEIAGVGRIRLNFFPHLIQEDMKIRQFPSVVRTPHSLQQSSMGNRHIGMCNKVLEQIEFLRREANIPAAYRDMTGRHVHFHVAEYDNGRTVCGGIWNSAEIGSYAR